jgi:hypothetical protein
MWLAGSMASMLAATLALDAARLYAVRSELRAFAEASALAAAAELDGTDAGFERARAVLLAQWQQSVLTARLVMKAVAEFGTSPEGPWRPMPEPPAGWGYVRVRAEARVPLLGLTALGSQGAEAVSATAVAAKDALGAEAPHARRQSRAKVGHIAHP